MHQKNAHSAPKTIAKLQSPALGAIAKERKMDSAPRFRKIKKSLKSQNTPSQSKQINKRQAKSTLLQIAHELYLKRRLKALLVDIFMIYTPIVYLAYVIVGGAQEFRSNQPIIFACFLAYACISAIFIAKSGQTPGLRYVELRIVRADRAESVDSGKHFCGSLHGHFLVP